MLDEEWFYGLLDEETNTISIGPFEADNHYEDAICYVTNDNYDGLENAKLICSIPELIRVKNALEQLVEQFKQFEDSENKNQTDAFYNLVKYAFPKWDIAKQVLIEVEQKLNPKINTVPSMVPVPSLTQDQIEYLNDLLNRSKTYDPTTVIGGPEETIEERLERKANEADNMSLPEKSLGQLSKEERRAALGIYE